MRQRLLIHQLSRNALAAVDSLGRNASRLVD
jgi:hypothetical protein